MDAAGLAHFIAGKIGQPVASQLPTKRSKNSGGLHRTARQSRFVHERPDSPTIFLKLLEHASRFFDIRWPQDDQTFFRCPAGGEIGVFNVHFGLGEALRDLTQNTGLASSLDSEHVGLKREYSGFA